MSAGVWYRRFLIAGGLLLGVAVGTVACQPTTLKQPSANTQAASLLSATMPCAAASQPELAPPVLTVSGKPLTMADLQELEQVSCEGEGQSHRGVRFLDVLKAGEVTAGSVSMLASDG